MFGPALLVNPVTQQLFSARGVSSTLKPTRQVYLPGTLPWTNFWTGERINAGQHIDASAPIETIPLFVKAGSIIPMGPLMEYATEKAADPMELRIYPGANGTFTLYEDENDTYKYEHGSYATIQFSWDDASKTLSIGDREGTFPGMKPQRTFNIVIVKPSHGVGLESTTADRQMKYDGRNVKVKL